MAAIFRIGLLIGDKFQKFQIAENVRITFAMYESQGRNQDQ